MGAERAFCLLQKETGEKTLRSVTAKQSNETYAALLLEPLPDPDKGQQGRGEKKEGRGDGDGGKG